MQQGMKAKQYLEQLQDIDICISQDIAQLEDMKTNATNAGSFDYSAERVQTSPSGDGLCNTVTGYVDFNAHINAEIDHFYDAKQKIIREIRKLHNPVFNQILFKVYVEYKPLITAAREMGRSYNFVIKQHGNALEKFEETYKNLKYLT